MWHGASPLCSWLWAVSPVGCSARRARFGGDLPPPAPPYGLGRAASLVGVVKPVGSDAPSELRSTRHSPRADALGSASFAPSGLGRRAFGVWRLAFGVWRLGGRTPIRRGNGGLSTYSRADSRLDGDGRWERCGRGRGHEASRDFRGWEQRAQGIERLQGWDSSSSSSHGWGEDDELRRLVGWRVRHLLVRLWVICQPAIFRAIDQVSRVGGDAGFLAWVKRG